jgi:hypothetical protein
MRRDKVLSFLLGEAPAAEAAAAPPAD